MALTRSVAPRAGRRAIAALACLLAAAAGVPSLASAAVETPGPVPVRIAVLGDSITDGSSGDYTWRYFLERHLRAVGSDVDLVGPRDDLFDMESFGRGHSYADPDFDRDHGAEWGDSMAWQFNPVAPVMEEHQPDVLVNAIGSSDLRFWLLSPERVLELVEERVAVARSVDPDIDVVLVQVFAEEDQVPNGRAYNALLGARAAELSTPRSRVVVALADPTYRTSSQTDAADTWDDIHPDTSGQVKYAASVADALAELGVGAPYPRPLAVPPEGLRHAPELQAAVGEESATLWWSAPPGATAHDVWMEDLSARSAPRLALSQVRGTTVQVQGLTPGSTYALRVLPRKHLQAALPDMQSNAVVLTVPGGPPAPQPTLGPTPSLTPSPTPGLVSAATPPVPPRGLDVRPARGALRVSWSPVPGAASYLVLVRDRDARTGWRSLPTSATALRIEGLRAGARHAVRVQALGEAGISAPTSAVRGIPTAPTPPRPRRLRIVGDGQAPELRWRRVGGATHYRVSYRSARPGAPWRTLPEVPQRVTRLVLTPLTRGRHLIRVRSFHDLVRGGADTVVHRTM